MTVSEGDRGSLRPGRSLVLFSLLLSLMPAADAAAQVPDTLRRDTVYEIEPIGVRAVRPSTTAGGVSAVVLRLDSVRMRPAPILEDVLREIPLVQVRTNSRGEAQLALRGAEERQVAILLDGVPLTLGWDHRTDLSVVPLTAAQSVTLVRGLSSILHGPNVLGGAVEIGLGSVPSASPEPLTVAAGIDQEGGYSVAAGTGTTTDLGDGELLVRAGVGHRDRRGVPAPDHLDAEFYPALTQGELLVNSQSTLTDAFVTARYDGDRTWIAATATGYEAERGVPPELVGDGPRLWHYPNISRVVGILTGGTGAFGTPVGRGEVTFSLGVDAGRTEIHDFLLPSDADTETDPGAFFTELNETEESEDLTLTARLLGSHGIGSDAQLRAALTYADVNHDEVITTEIPSGSPVETPGSFRQRLWSVGAEVDVPFSVEAGPIRGGRVSGGLAWDGADTPETGGAGEGQTMTEWGGRLGVSGTTGGGGLMLHAAVSRRGRFPALREMYSRALGRFEPNPGLRPEILTALEAGFTTRRGALDVQLVGFHQQLDDAIVRGPAPAGSPAAFQRINRDEIRSTGIELLGGYTVGRLGVETELTVQDVEAIVRDQADADAVRAEYEPEVVAGIGGTFPLPLELEMGAEVTYMGRQYCATPVTATEVYAQLDSSARTDLQVARSFRLGSSVATFSRLGVELALENLTDEAIYDQCGLPQPGRTLRLQVRLR